MTPEQRYQQDTLFHTMVDQLEYYLHVAVFSGTEIREAAMLALIHYEAKTVRPIMVHSDGRIERVERPPAVRPTALNTNTIEELRAAVEQGAGHECSEWRDRGWSGCMLCGRNLADGIRG